MTPQVYDAWYDTPRGRWIGDVEWDLLQSALDLQVGETLLDVGCGTGWFTRRAAACGARVTGVDLDADSLAFARQHASMQQQFATGDAVALPFPDRAFDKTMSVAALCFVKDWPSALAEIVRVTRRRFALGLLHRHSVLWLRKGRRGGIGAYRGAHWHTRAEIQTALNRLPVRDVAVAYGVFLPAGGHAARLAEAAASRKLPLGSFMVCAGAVDAA
jgi:SAM-dependent methyltransferase